MKRPAGTVFVVEDEPTARRAVEAVASSLGLPSETYRSAEDFLAEYDPSRPGCLVADVRLKPTSGLELQIRLASTGSTLPVILIGANLSVATAVLAMRRGALTVIEKPYRADVLADAIREGLARDQEIRVGTPGHDQVSLRLTRLGTRERHVMGLILDGRPNKAIANDLGISGRTVDRVRASVFAKMGVANAVELARVVASYENRGAAEHASVTPV